ncbi:hypothetical protein CPB83DRAFT_854495 [Crepidotus variabilis]|uniref:Non-reducing end beta-L-arabinofuranosidase-like GH127 middle domain-containing protein n=1 Tax=Crepidotus variabilis TaxID=179855 RepID=A0A9P6EG77_9AGAR|nr:hypothetical protein CPB83DRAFT_854495 [Crepidotus variabilis]
MSLCPSSNLLPPMKSLFTLLTTLYSVSVVSAQNATGLAPLKFRSLPLGKIMPAGWLKDQLTVQTNGLAGHQHEFYRYVSQTNWLGGNVTYSDLQEAAPYWFNGLVPNAVLANSDALKKQTSYFLDYVLSHQGTDGWLGPEVNTTLPRILWARYPFLYGAIQMVEVDPSLTDRVVTAAYKFVKLANTMIKNKQGLDDWTNSRWHDFLIPMQWLYDNHPNGNEALLLETMNLLKAAGYPWDKIFSDQYFPKGPVDHISNPLGYGLMWHGVNVAMALKSSAAAYRVSHSQTDLDNASAAWDRLFQYHGRPSGIFAADEYLAGLDAVRGTELCLVVEAMFSGSYLYQVIGNPKYADRVERITYNALFATITGNMWSRQYLQQQNQIASKNMSPNPFPNDGAYSNVFGLDPNYPCCTVNFPQGFPKFISNAFVTTPDGASLVQVYLGPFNTNANLQNGNNVQVTVDTQYPFSDTFKTTLTASKAFTYYVRIPSWVTKGTISVNSGTTQPLSPSNGLQAVKVASGTTQIVLNLPADIKTEQRPNGSIAVQRGPLHYAFDIPRNQTILAQNAQQPLAVDLQFGATASWQYAIDPSTLRFDAGKPPATLPSPIYDSGKPTPSISVTACLISWPIAGDTFVSSPPTSPACTGSKSTIKLIPYGATKLRISEFPVFKST